jgi:hypothetical protein
MSNSGEFYNHTTYPQTGAAGSSASLRAELESVESGFNKLPSLVGGAGKLVRVAASGDTMETSDVISDNGTNANITGDLTIQGGNLGVDADSMHAIPNVAADTLTLNAASQTLTNKTLVASSNTITTAASGTLAATELNAALAELQADIDTRSPSSHTHTATVITNTPSGNLAATNVQAALNELQSDIDSLDPSNYLQLSGGSLTGLLSVNDGADIASASTVDLTAATGNTVRITGTTPITAFTMNAGQQMELVAVGALPLTYHATTMNINGGVSYTCAAGDRLSVFKDVAGVVRVNITKQDGSAVVATPYVRQTVLTGAVDTNGLPSFGGATGSTTVTTSTTLTATAANGIANRIGSITNPSWTGLSTNGAMYLYLDIDSAGVCTTGSTTLQPNYRWGGADVTTNNQFTFNIQEMVGKVGNGATAAQTYRVFVGEVTVAGSVVTAITWYALMGRYISPDQSIPANGTAITVSHNLGMNTPHINCASFIKNTTSEGSYINGDMMQTSVIDNAPNAMATSVARLSAQVNGIYTAIGFANKSTAARFAITPANWRFVFNVKRDW